MFSYQPQIYENNQWQALSPWARPFTDGTALNDVLDAGCINLSLSSRYNAIKPFTPIRIIISENGVEVDRIYRLVSSTKRTRRTFAPSVGAKYDWTINTIELTKQLERRFIGTLTSTRYLHTDYAAGTSVATGIFSDYSEVESSHQTPTYNNTIKTPDVLGNIIIPSCQSTFTLGSRGRWYNEDYNHPVDGKGCYAIITYPSGKTVNTGYIEKTTYSLNAGVTLMFLPFTFTLIIHASLGMSQKSRSLAQPSMLPFFSKGLGFIPLLI